MPSTQIKLITNIEDVSISNPQDGDALVYSGGFWVASPVGDMDKSTYDQNNDGVVDAILWDNIELKPNAFTPDTHSREHLLDGGDPLEVDNILGYTITGDPSTVGQVFVTSDGTCAFKAMRTAGVAEVGTENNLSYLTTQNLVPYGCRVIKTNTQTISGSTITPISFNTEIYDPGLCWTNTNPTRLTAPVSGYYMAGGSIELTAAQITAACRLFIAVRVNGSWYAGSNENHTISGKAAMVGVTTGMINLNVGDYVEIIVYHDIAGDKTSQAASTTNQHICNGWLQRVV